MSCILCFNDARDDEQYSIHHYLEGSIDTAAELIDRHFNFAEVNIATYEYLIRSRTFVIFRKS